MSNAIGTQGMKLQFSAAGGVPASGSVTLTAGLADAEKITIAGHDFTWKSAAPTGDQAAICGTLAESARDMADQINESATVGIAGVVKASANGPVLTVTAVAPGVGGNAITFAATGVHVTAITGATLTGGAGLGYQDVPEVLNIDGPNETATLKDVTHLGSTSREKRPALKDSGDISFSVNWIPTNPVHQALHTAIQNRTLDNYRIVYTDAPASSASFVAYLTTHNPKGALDDRMTADLKLSITGDVTYTPGA